MGPPGVRAHPTPSIRSSTLATEKAPRPRLPEKTPPSSQAPWHPQWGGEACEVTTRRRQAGHAETKVDQNQDRPDVSPGMRDCSSPGCLEHLPRAAEATLGPPCGGPRALADGRCGPTGGACCTEEASRLPHSL